MVKSFELFDHSALLRMKLQVVDDQPPSSQTEPSQVEHSTQPPPSLPHVPPTS